MNHPFLAIFMIAAVLQVIFKMVQPSLSGPRALLDKGHKISQAIHGSGAEGMLHFAGIRIGGLVIDLEDIG
jgi:hypothetical protein